MLTLKLLSLILKGGNGSGWFTEDGHIPGSQGGQFGESRDNYNNTVMSFPLIPHSISDITSNEEETRVITSILDDVNERVKTDNKFFIRFEPVNNEGKRLPVPNEPENKDNDYAISNDQKIIDSLMSSVIYDISIETGLSEADINLFINQWNKTSNSDYRSLCIQETASRVFNQTLSNFQEDIIRSIDSDLEEFHYEAEEKYQSDIKRGKISENYSLEEYKKNNMPQVYYKEETLKGKRRIFDNTGNNPYLSGKLDRSHDSESFHKEEKIVRAIYRITQKKLSDILPDTDYITLFRGISSREFTDSERNIDVNIESNTLESWTLSPHTAMQFGNTLVKARVPKKRIFSIFSTGLGVMEEAEFIVLGGNKNDILKLVYCNSY